MINYQVGISVFLLLISYSSVEFTCNFFCHQLVYAHIFFGDESASFLALVEQIEAETDLVKRNLLSPNDNNNKTLAQQHADSAAKLYNFTVAEEIEERNQRVANELNSALEDLEQTLNSSMSESSSTDLVQITDKVDNIDAILQEIVDVRIEEEQLNNSTIRALTINEILSETVKHYAMAFGIEGLTGTQDTGNNSVVNLAEYQSAHALAPKALEVFNETKDIHPTENASAIVEIESNLKEFTNAIDNRTSYNSVFGIAEEQIIPKLQTEFGLKLKS